MGHEANHFEVELLTILKMIGGWPLIALGVISFNFCFVHSAPWKCMDLGSKHDCRWANPWSCRHDFDQKWKCRKTCGYCKDGSEDLLDTVCYDETDKCGKGGYTEDRCYARGSDGTWMFTNCKKFCHYCLPGHPGEIIKDHPHWMDEYETTKKPLA